MRLAQKHNMSFGREYAVTRHAICVIQLVYFFVRAVITLRSLSSLSSLSSLRTVVHEARPQPHRET